jgi:methionyl-tRNA formyltransferase
MRVLFAGTPELAVPTLRSLFASSHTVVGVLTAPDRARGLGRTLAPPPIKVAAEDFGLPVLQPEQLRTDAREAVAELSPDLLAVFAYGKIFGPRFLSLFQAGALNVHPSLLPRYRGPAPIPAAIRNRDRSTGITIQTVAREMDAGDIVLQEQIALTGDETTESLSDYVSDLAGPLLVTAIDAIERGDASFAPQDHEQASYTRLLQKSDGDIDWKDDAEAIDALVRSVTPWPKARTSFRGAPLTVIRTAIAPGDACAGKVSGQVGRIVAVDRSLGILVETGNACIALKEVQLPSKKPVDWKSFVNGAGPLEGELLGGS